MFPLAETYLRTRLFWRCDQRHLTPDARKRPHALEGDSNE